MNRVPLRERARNRWRALLPLLGVASSYLTGKHGQCPLGCDGKRSFRFDNKQGEGTWICTHCGAGDGVRLVELVNRWDFKEAAPHIERALGDAPVEEAKAEASSKERFDAMAKVWARGVPVTLETHAGRYLNWRTGCTAFAADLRAASKLRHVPSASDHPALLAMVRAADDTPINLHRTYLGAAGGKADVDPPRMVMAGELPPGCAIRLAPPASVMGIAEGIETALSAAALFGVPTWAAISATVLEQWWPPAGVSEVVIFGDNDPSATGQAAAWALAKRLIAKRIPATVRLPELVGDDWNDVLQGEGRSAA